MPNKFESSGAVLIVQPLKCSRLLDQTIALKIEHNFVSYTEDRLNEKRGLCNPIRHRTIECDYKCGCEYHLWT